MVTVTSAWVNAIEPSGKAINFGSGGMTCTGLSFMCFGDDQERHFRGAPVIVG